MSTRILGDKGGLYQYNLNEGYTWDAEYYQDMEGRQFDSKLHSSPEVRNAFWLFADAVRDDTPFLVQPEEGVVVMRLLDAIYESARTGEPRSSSDGKRRGTPGGVRGRTSSRPREAPCARGRGGVAAFRPV